MLDIIGNIKVDETKTERIKYFFASLQSCFEYKDFIKIILSLHTPSMELFLKTKDLLENSGCDFFLQHTQATTQKSYGEIYTDLITKYSKNELILNFIEDHFLIIQNQDFKELLQYMLYREIEICKSTFFKIEQNSSKTLKLTDNNKFGKVFKNNNENYNEYCKYYGKRFYIGVNFITTRDFALNFWSRNIGNRPHPYEIGNFNLNYFHTCMIPNIEIQVSIDDDYGENNTCLLKRNYNKDKFNSIWKSLEAKHG
jgi:hypothetical protein